MKWSRNLRLSIRALSRSWSRTLLSITGVAIGIASVVVLIGAGAGAEQALKKALEPLGHNLLVVNAAKTEADSLRGVSRLSTTLTLEDHAAIDREVDGVLRIAPVAEQPFLASADGRTVSVRVHGTTAQFALVRNFPLVAGRHIDEDDLRTSRRVVVVSALVVDELFQGELPLGETLLVGGAPFRVIGVTKKKGVVDGANEDEVVMVPLTTAMRRLMNVDSLNRIYVQTAAEDMLATARSQIESLLRQRHDISIGGADDFAVQDQTAVLRVRQQAGSALSRLVPALCALALGLGGVGLLAVSLLSVRERYPEIGLRLAVGGRPREILLQFLTEAVLISVLGGALGLILGAAGIWTGESLTRWSMVLSWQAVVYPLTISVAIAVVFGAYPALRAARLDPILALNSR